MKLSAKQLSHITLVCYWMIKTEDYLSKNSWSGRKSDFKKWYDSWLNHAITLEPVPSFMCKPKFIKLFRKVLSCRIVKPTDDVMNPVSASVPEVPKEAVSEKTAVKHNSKTKSL
ncbi:MAG: hypothetical protein ACI4V7_09305 [Succinivibrionaceae bacterium]